MLTDKQVIKKLEILLESKQREVVAQEQINIDRDRATASCLKVTEEMSEKRGYERAIEEISTGYFGEELIDILKFLNERV